MKKIKIFSLLILLSLIAPALSFANEDETGTELKNKKGPGIEMRVQEKEQRIENIMVRASTTEKRLENRENNIEKIRAKIASTTASSGKRLEKLDDRLNKQLEQMDKVKDRLLNKEIKITDVLGKIAGKIEERINILANKGLNMTAAKAKLAEATIKIEDMTAESANLATLIGTEITETNQTQLFTAIKSAQEKIKSLAKNTHALLVDTVKEITKVLPKDKISTTTNTN